MVADVVVVGGGSAGNVLAARLSEDPERKVAIMPDIPSANTNLAVIMVAERLAELMRSGDRISITRGSVKNQPK